MSEDTPYTVHDAWADRGKPKKDDLYAQAFEAWRAEPTPSRLKDAVTRLQPEIDKAVNFYAGQQASPVLRQRARLLAANAIRSYDPKHGAALHTHVNNQLRSLQRMAPDINDPLAPPERFRRQQAEIAKAEELLRDDLGREATDEELADITRLPIRRIAKVRARMRPRISSSRFDNVEDDDEAPDLVGQEETDYDQWIDAVYHDLPPVDRLILQHRTGYRGADTLDNQELARRLNLTPAAVSQRAARIQKKLDSFDAPAR